MSSSERYFKNPYPDYNGKNIEIDYDSIISLIKQYVNEILMNTLSNSSEDERGDLYVGNAGKYIIVKITCMTVMCIFFLFQFFFRYCIYVL